jgi:microcin C transport system substrate-binding protein
MIRVWISRALVALALFTVACGGGSTPDSGPGAPATAPTADGRTVSMDKNDYPVFPDRDAGADPSVPAEQGGRGFTGEGWQTNTDFDLIGDPRAIKGGVFRRAMSDYPATLRYLGPNISVWNASLHGLAYERLIELHPTSLDYIPSLATHWQISEDQKTYRFRIDPNARFNDGVPVTSDDVIASWSLYVDPSVQDPLNNSIYNNFERPVAESKYIVRIVANVGGWTPMYYLASMHIYPAHALKAVDGGTYVKEWNDKMLPGSGPYFVTPADLDKGNRISIRRRPDYWAEKYRRNVGLGNFDEIRDVVVRDRNLEFEMVKRGDLDFYTVNRAQMWVEELNFDRIQNGQIQKRKVWNHSPGSIQGMALNTRRPPLDDLRVRKALTHLFNRELMVEKLMFNEYELMDSVFPGSIYANPTNVQPRYNPELAVQLLAEAGWKERNPQGRLVKGGTTLALELLYMDRNSERFLTIFQEDLARAGITLNLRYVTFETGLKLMDEQQFTMVTVAYGGGGPFPVPEQFWHSEQADRKASYNLTGFKNPRVDQIIEAYELELNVQKRAELLRELDGIVTSAHMYLLEWYAPFDRFIYWNKFGMPPGIITRIGDYRDPISLWWLDPVKNQQLEQAMRDSSVKLDVGDTENRYWLDTAKVDGH